MRIVSLLLICMMFFTACMDKDMPALVTDVTVDTVTSITITPETTAAPETTMAPVTTSIDVTVDTVASITIISETTAVPETTIAPIAASITETTTIPYNPPAEPWCYIHDLTFHSFPDGLTDLVEPDAFKVWLEQDIPGKNGCPFGHNIWKFLREFDISQETFEDFYYTPSCYYSNDYPIDLLYGNDEDAVDIYYANYKEREDYREKFASLERIKWSLVDEMMLSEEPSWKNFYKEYFENKVAEHWSIVDFVRAVGISMEDFRMLIDDLRVIEYPGKTLVLNCFDFDFDALYAQIGEVPGVTGIDKINEDMLFCSQPALNAKKTQEHVPTQTEAYSTIRDAAETS